MRAIAPLLACAGVFAMTVLAASARPQPVPSPVAENFERGTARQRAATLAPEAR